MSKIWSKTENKILIILLLFSISIGLWNNFRQLWMQDNGLDPTQISRILSYGTLFCVVGILIFSKYIKLNKIKNFRIPYWMPKKEMPRGFNTEQPRRSHGLTHVHHFFTKRNLAILSCAWSVATSARAKFLLTSLMYKSSVLCAPLMSNYFAEKKGHPRGGWIGKERSGTLYCPAIHSEVMLLPQINSRKKSVFISEAPKTYIPW